jgi:hypothetical protein
MGREIERTVKEAGIDIDPKSAAFAQNPKLPYTMGL